MRVYRLDSFQLHADTLVLTCEGTVLNLGPKVVETLLALVEHRGESVSKERLLDRVWPEGFVSESNLAQNIYVLRKTFRERGCENAIQTVPGVGYRLTVPVEELRVSAAPASRRRFRIRNMLTGAGLAACIAIAVALLGQTHAHATPQPSRAQRLYQIGRYYWNMRTREGVRKSLDYFTQALDANPNDARLYAALADANVAMGDYCYGTHLPAVYIARAHAYAEQALSLDPQSAQALASAGFVAFHEGRSADALRELRSAIALQPSYAPAHEWYGIALFRSGERSAGQAQLAIASRLDPLSVSTTAWMSAVAYREGRYNDAIRYARMALELNPVRLDALLLLGKANVALGQKAAARRAFNRFASIDPFYRATLAQIFARRPLHGTKLAIEDAAPYVAML